MARTKFNQRPETRPEPVAMGATGGRKPPSKWSVALLAVSILTAVWAAAMLTPFGRVAYYYFFAYSEFYMGVLTLVSLSITIMVGLVSTDRLVLSIRQRVLLQSAHRTTGVIAVTALVAHVWTKFMEEHITALDIFIPFLAPYNRVFVGLGTLSGWVMIMVMWTGMARSKFIGRGKPWMWRSIHAVSYLMWPLALIHGLAAGRPAATWVTVSYVICVLGVLVGLAVRLSVSLNRKKDFSSTATGAMKPVGAVVPTNSGAAAPKRKRRDEPEPPAAPESFRPATPRPPVMERPASAMPASGIPSSAMPASSMPISSNPISPMPYDDDVYARRNGRRRADERYDEPTGSISRRAIESYDDPASTGSMSRRAIEEERYRYEDVPRRGFEDTPPARRRYADDDRYEEEPPRRARRYADDDRYDDAPPPPRARREFRDADPRTTGEFRAPDYRTGEFQAYEDAPRRGRRDDGDVTDSGRHSRSEFVDLAPRSEGWRGRTDPNYREEGDETPTLVDMASRRARRQAQQAEPIRPRGGRRGDRVSGGNESLDDDQYWRQLRGEAR